MTAPAGVLKLAETFEQNRDEYRAASYNETQLRRQFLDPFFAALGWDVANERGESEQRRDVMHEYSTKAEVDGRSRSRAPDYAFRIGESSPDPVFFVEAKKPSVNLKENAAFALQTREYGWNAKLPFCVLTDFEELAVYDCRFEPVVTDGSEKARTLYFKYTDYADQWDKIAAFFSREAVRAGALLKKAQEEQKKGTVTVDAKFLDMIGRWREQLASNLVRNNKGLTAADLNYAVQMTIDRIIFLRMCEDRDLEPWGRLQELSHGTKVYGALFEWFQEADEFYNSGLFHFPGARRSGVKKCGGFEDALTPDLKIDDDVLAGIIGGLYRPNFYNFRVMPVEILGQVYEQFLGKVIQLKPPHGVKVEDKPEVRKAGGVYYTPSYIVDYIVRQTVGKLCEGKTPRQVSALRVLDPACGSGSFLLGAYSYLLGWHLDFYTKDDPKLHCKGANAPLFAVPDPLDPKAPPSYRLTTREKKRILLNNIYGVDIDRQAVEVTKLSLLLKVLEDESSPGLKLLREPALPDLDANVKCGNSLIGHAFYNEEENASLSDDERERINAFDWEDEFHDIIKAGGFDAVIGNPPYVRQELLGNDKSYFQQHYEVYNGVADLYVYFIEKGLSLLKMGGLLSFIVISKWMRAKYGEPLRRWMKQQRIEEITDFGGLCVFQNATTYPCMEFTR